MNNLNIKLEIIPKLIDKKLHSIIHNWKHLLIITKSKRNFLHGLP